MPQADTIRALVADARPELSGAEVAFLGDGCDHDNYLVGSRHVLRVPKNREVEGRLIVEVSLLNHLGPLPVVVPRPLGPFRSAAHPYAYSIYNFIPGMSGHLAERIDRAHAAHALGGLLAHLQRVDVARVAAFGVPRERDPVRAWSAHLQGESEVLADVLSRLPADALAPTGLTSASTAVLLHNDLWGEHILIDEHSGEAVAVIDWADAAIGDPSLDYSGLLAWLGEPFLRSALRAGDITFEESDIERARFFALAGALHSIALGRQLDEPNWIDSGELALGHLGY